MKKSKNAVTVNNATTSCRILAKDYRVSNDGRKTGLNGNDLVVGAPGAGKTGGYVTPNLLTVDHSMVVADTKGLLNRKYRRYLEKKGFRVVCIDFVNSEKSATYNMLDFVSWYDESFVNEDGSEGTRSVYRQKDLKKIANALLPDSTYRSDDIFWTSSARSVLVSLMAYVLEATDPASHHMGTVVTFFQQMVQEVAEYENSSSAEKKEWQGVSFFKNLEAEDPDSFAVRMYKMYSGNFQAEKCWSSIVQFVANALEVFTYREVRPLFYGNSTLDLADLGREKTILFVNISDTDRSMDAIVNVFYTQLLQTLCDEADRHEDGQLEVPVRIILDDFAANVYIPDFDKIISVIRSRRLSVSVILQSLSQLDGMYKDGKARTIISNCDCKVFLGGQESETAKSIADMAGRLPETIMNMESDQVLVFVRGQQPKMLEKVPPYSLDRMMEEQME